MSGAILDPAVLEAVKSLRGAELRALRPAGGGCINRCSLLELSDGSRIFLKENSAGLAGLFAAEAAGLAALRAAGPPYAPEPLAIVENAGRQFLLLEYIEAGRAGRGFFERFGAELAEMHRRTGRPEAGFEADNWIGAASQANGRLASWPEFFKRRRLAPQLALAGGRLGPELLKSAERLLERLDRLLPELPRKSLLHGDLWSGNFLAAADGRPVIIDPAVYHGDREADLAMTSLFGGFPEEFYSAYQAVWPLEPGWRERFELYNLYHVLNHCKLFGGAYCGQAAAIIKRFV